MEKQTFRGETIGLRARSSEMVELGPKLCHLTFEFCVFVLKSCAIARPSSKLPRGAAPPPTNTKPRSLAWNCVSPVIMECLPNFDEAIALSLNALLWRICTICLARLMSLSENSIYLNPFLSLALWASRSRLTHSL